MWVIVNILGGLLGFVGRSGDSDERSEEEEECWERTEFVGKKERERY